jgi:excisionase family DNA binding protein
VCRESAYPQSRKSATTDARVSLPQPAEAAGFPDKIELPSYPTGAAFGKLTPISRLTPEKRGVMTRLNEFVKTAEAARILGVSQNTVRAWAEAGKIPMRRNPANGYRLFLRRDLDRFLAKLARPIKD